MIESLEIKNHKTKELDKTLKRFDFNSALFIHTDDEKNLNFKRASTNIPRLSMLIDKGLNVRDLISYDTIFIEKKSIEQISKRLAWVRLKKQILLIEFLT